MATVTIGKLARQKIIEEVKTLLEEKRGALVISYAGVDANAVNGFRRKLRDNDARMLVVKNTLARIASSELGMGELSQFCVDQSALVFPCEDTILFTKLVMDFVRENKDKVRVLGAVIEGRVLGKDDIDVMSKLPSKDYLYGQVVGAVGAPLTGFLGVLNGILRKLVYVIKAIEEKQTKQSK